MINKCNLQFSVFHIGLKRVIILLFLSGISVVTEGQTRYAFVNLDYILENIPDYAKAQQELNAYSVKLQGEVDVLYQEITEMQNKYNSDKVFLTPAMREEREKAIAAKENKALMLQQQYFGPKGELFAKREELVKPLQDEVLEVIKDVAKEGNFGLIIDVAADNSILYYDAKLDKSKNVLRKLGYSIKSEGTGPLNEAAESLLKKTTLPDAKVKVE